MSLQVLNCALRFTWHPQYKNKHFYDITKCINFCKLCLIIMRKDLLTGGKDLCKKAGERH